MSWLRCSLSLLVIPAILATGCTTDNSAADQRAVMETYAEIAFASYEDSYNEAVVLDEAIDAFVANPTASGLEAAKDAWLAAREPYGQTEAYRFADGPIDAADGPEGLLNAWPLDEAYVDYVVGAPGAGIVNNADQFPTIDADLLVDLNERGAEENVSIGYHAIEFLLWGQDLSGTGAGNRPFTDYTTDANAERRKQYLATTSDLLLDHLKQMVDAWAPDESNYRSTFMSLDPEQALRNMLTGIGTLSKSELAVERIFVAVDNQDQEDEHSCFSDNTHRDIITNAIGIANVYRGSYQRLDGTSVSGRSLEDLVRDADSAVGDRISSFVNAALSTSDAIPVPFDRAIIENQDAVLTSVDALQDLGDSFVEGAQALGIAINTELPD
ncbi:MAG: imelysin family protein [Bacteroidota bacterium]